MTPARRAYIAIADLLLVLGDEFEPGSTRIPWCGVQLCFVARFNRWFERRRLRVDELQVTRLQEFLLQVSQAQS